MSVAEALFHLSVPLLNVLRGRMWIESGEAHGRSRQRACTQHRSAKIQPIRKERGRRREIVRLLRFRKYIRDIVPLVAPGVLIHRREEDSVSCHAARVPDLGRFLAIPMRGAKLCLFAYISPRGYPFWPPMNTEGTPLLKIRLVLVLSRS